MMLPRMETLRLRVIAQKGIHHKPCAEAEACDEGVQLAFNHEFGIEVAEAEKLHFDVAYLLLQQICQGYTTGNRPWPRILSIRPIVP